MSTPGRPKGEYRSAQHEGTPVTTSAVTGLGGLAMLGLGASRARNETGCAPRIAA